MENCVGKVVKISGKDSWGRDVAIVGIVYAQKEGYKGESTVYSLIKTNGSIADSVAVKHSGDVKVTSTRVAPEVREALKEAYKTKLKLDAFKARYEKELSAHKEALDGSLAAVKASSKEMTPSEFRDKVRSLFAEKYPATGGYYSTKSFDVVCYSPSEITVEQSQDVDKWANPEKYSFLYREYDNTIHISYDSKSYKDFCARHAPRVIPELAKYCDAEVEASLGDKEWLSVGRRYTFPIKFGYSEKSIEELKERVWGERVKQPSIAEQIARAEGMKAGGTASRDSKNKVGPEGR